MWFLRKQFKQPDGIPNYRVGPHYDGIGTGNFVYEAEFQNPVYLFRGAGRVAGSLRVTQHPQVYFTYRNTRAGLGGLQAGQMAFQPLVNNGG